jgi:uncharacterized SAM-binding protein YcdF (DUF218 family)
MRQQGGNAGMTAPVTVGAPRRRVRRLWRGLLGVAAALTLLGVAACYERGPLLRAGADLWIVSDPPAPADVVAVFGGGVEVRPFAAAAYYHDGLVGKILVSNARESPSEQLGVRLTDAAANRAVLLKLGVPAAAIENFGYNLRNTHDEALALRDWATQHDIRRIIVPTEIFTARRLRWMLHHVFGEDPTVLVPALNPPEYRDDDWWRDERGVISFQNEVLKYLYYRLKY